MQIIIILMMIFVFMLLAPIIGSVIFYKKHKGDILYINQGRIRNARYFGLSFSAIMKKQMPHIKQNKIFLSKEEEVLNAESISENEKIIDKLVISRMELFQTPKTVETYQKEIYSAGDLILDKKNLRIRAAYSEKRIIVGNDVHVMRWIDAEQTMSIYDNCELGISATAGDRLSIGNNCSFRRLYAPEILLGQYPGDNRNALKDKNPEILNMGVQRNRTHNVRYINKERMNKDGVVDYSIISYANVKVTENVIVQGDIRSHKSVRIFDGAVVCGNIFAEKDIFIGRNVAVLGNVFSQGNIKIEQNAMIGRPNRISSVIARKNITINDYCFVYGYISCEKQGMIIRSNTKEPIDQKKEDYSFLDPLIREKHLSFKNLMQYNQLGEQGYRKNKYIEDVIIPENAEKVYRSMFYNCENLKKVELASQITEIGEYAFCGCRKLKIIIGMESGNIRQIGRSSFENCENLTEICIPDTVEEIGNAAFKGCIHLKKIDISKMSKLRFLGDHAFNGCLQIEEIYLPNTMEYIGISAFRECLGLKKIYLPVSCKNQAGIEEIVELNPNIKLIWHEGT